MIFASNPTCAKTWTVTSGPYSLVSNAGMLSPTAHVSCRWTLKNGFIIEPNVCSLMRYGQKLHTLFRLYQLLKKLHTLFRLYQLLKKLHTLFRLYQLLKKSHTLFWLYQLLKNSFSATPELKQSSWVQPAIPTQKSIIVTPLFGFYKLSTCCRNFLCLSQRAI